MELFLFKREYDVSPAWGVNRKDTVKSYITIRLIINLSVFFTFVVSVPNKSFCYRNPITALLKALESESVGMQKYDMTKERLRTLNFWQKL